MLTEGSNNYIMSLLTMYGKGVRPVFFDKDNIILDKAAFMTNSGKQTKISVRNGFEGKLKWKSLDESVAAVDENGVVTAIKRGETTVVASCGEKSAKCIVTVDYDAQNPIIPHTWGLYIADGEPHVYDGVMYVYGSHDEPGGVAEDGTEGWCSYDYHVIYSEDMKNWVDAGVSFTFEQVPVEYRGEGAIRLWAPDVFRHPKTGKFYLLACSNWGRWFVSESDSPIGPFLNPRQITKGGVVENIGDPSALVDEETGRIFVANPGSDFYVCEIDADDVTKMLPETYRSVKPYMTKDYHPFEGPSFRKRGEYYYYIYIQDIKPTPDMHPTRMAYLMAKDPLGPYKYGGLIISTYDFNNATNVHGSIEEFNGEWYVFYHTNVPDMAMSRTMFVDKITFNDDGTINEAERTTSGFKGAFVKGERIYAGGAVDYIKGRDDKHYVSRCERRADGRVTKINDVPYVYFDEAGQYIGYKYVNYTGVDAISISALSDGDATLKVMLAPDSEPIAKIRLNSTNGEYNVFTAEICGITESRAPLYFALEDGFTASQVQMEWIDLI
ncbi:MAG: hypothetical protein E7315_05225 [Clostridiales bacterium]|nr:hypothetical protein [Clostridiales bacterium]